VYCISQNTTGEAVVDGRSAPATNPENLSRGRPRTYAYVFFSLTECSKN